MELLFKLVIPAILILSPIVFQIELTSKRIRGKTRLSIAIICLLTFTLGIPISGITTWLSMKESTHSISNDATVDDMSSLILFVFGVGINLVLTFFVGLIGLFIQYKSRHK